MLPALTAGTAGSASGDACGVFDGLGEACKVDGGYELTLPGGQRLFTHGPDPVTNAALGPTLLAPLRAPPCVPDPLQHYHNHVIYAHPVDKPNRIAEMSQPLRDLAAEANGLLYAEGAEFGAPVEYRFLCDDLGRVKVSAATLPFPSGQAQYTQLVYALQAMGFDDPHAKYWVWVDDRSSCGCAGIASAPLDTDRSPMNNANAGPLFGANYGYNAFVSMHENGHNLGAVNPQAPDQSGGAHCNDGRDVMCYSDGGWNSSYRNDVCGATHFDCDHDTYFHPDPPAGSFLARRWQIAAPVNRFVQGCLHVDELIVAPGASAEVPVPAACVGHVYAVFGADPLAYTTIGTSYLTGAPLANLYVNKVSLCWYAGPTELSCPANAKPWGHEGRVPTGADRAVVTWDAGPQGRFTLSVV